MNEKLIGKWAQITLSNGGTWIGRVEEWDEDAIFISNGHEFGHPEHKGAECTNGEVSAIVETDSREFLLEMNS